MPEMMPRCSDVMKKMSSACSCGDCVPCDEEQHHVKSDAGIGEKRAQPRPRSTNCTSAGVVRAPQTCLKHMNQESTNRGAAQAGGTVDSAPRLRDHRAESKHCRLIDPTVGHAEEPRQLDHHPGLSKTIAAECVDRMTRSWPPSTPHLRLTQTSRYYTAEISGGKL